MGFGVVKKIGNVLPITQKPIYVRCDNEISFEEEKSIIKGLLEAKKYLPENQIYYLGKETNIKEKDNITLNSGQSIVDSTRKTNNQISSLELLSKVLESRDNEGSRDRIDVLFTGTDLFSIRPTGEKLSFVFGTAANSVTVQSVYRFRSLDISEKDLCIRRTVRHELGHILKMADDLTRSNTEENFGEHCTNTNCSMRQGNSISEWLAEAKQEQKSDQFYCSQCITDLKNLYEKDTGRPYKINNDITYDSIYISDKLLENINKQSFSVKSVISRDNKQSAFRVLGPSNESSKKKR